MREAYGQGVWYDPEAEVAHKVFEYRTEFRWLVDRAFWQGYSKRAMETISPNTGNEETDFLNHLFTDATPAYAHKIAYTPSFTSILQFVMLFIFTILVGMGYLYGVIKW
jgi:hypothetical protein